MQRDFVRWFPQLLPVSRGTNGFKGQKRPAFEKKGFGDAVTEGGWFFSERHA